MHLCVHAHKRMLGKFHKCMLGKVPQVHVQSFDNVSCLGLAGLRTRLRLKTGSLLVAHPTTQISKEK